MYQSRGRGNAFPGSHEAQIFPLISRHDNYCSELMCLHSFIVFGDSLVFILLAFSAPELRLYKK
jgi:hypothetical protein